MIPSEFLPPPFWKKWLVRLLIAAGNIWHRNHRGYFFLNVQTDQLFWNKQQAAVFGLTDCPSCIKSNAGWIGTYENLFNSVLWDAGDQQMVRGALELALKHRQEFSHQFCVRHATTGELIIVQARAWWLFDEKGEAWALWGWNQQMKLAPAVKDAKVDIIKAKQDIAIIKESGMMPTNLKSCVSAALVFTSQLR